MDPGDKNFSVREKSLKKCFTTAHCLQFEGRCVLVMYVCTKKGWAAAKYIYLNIYFYHMFSFLFLSSLFAEWLARISSALELSRLKAAYTIQVHSMHADYATSCIATFLFCIIQCPSNYKIWRGRKDKICYNIMIKISTNDIDMLLFNHFYNQVNIVCNILLFYLDYYF